jgi:hypothetical protein
MQKKIFCEEQDDQCGDIAKLVNFINGDFPNGFGRNLNDQNRFQ